MLVVANCLGGPSELGGWLEEMFVQVASTARGVPGLWEFHLRKLEQEGPECLYVSLTIWEAQPFFSDWRTGDRFAMAHARVREDREKLSRLRRRKRYDFNISSIPDLEYLDGLVLSRLLETYPGLITPPARFSEVLTIAEERVLEKNG